jgi:hypothetical protein
MLDIVRAQLLDLEELEIHQPHFVYTQGVKLYRYNIRSETHNTEARWRYSFDSARYIEVRSVERTLA